MKKFSVVISRLYRSSFLSCTEAPAGGHRFPLPTDNYIREPRRSIGSSLDNDQVILHHLVKEPGIFKTIFNAVLHTGFFYIDSNLLPGYPPVCRCRGPVRCLQFNKTQNTADFSLLLSGLMRSWPKPLAATLSVKRMSEVQLVS